MDQQKTTAETTATPPMPTAWQDYRYLIATLAGLIAAYLLWQFVVQPDEIYLTDMPFAVEEFEWMEPKINTSIDGNPLKIGAAIYSNGLGAHAKTVITCTRPSGMRYFKAEVGVDAEMSQDLPSSVVFMVKGDGILLEKTPVLRAGELPHLLSVDVDGYTHIEITIDDAGDGNHSDHADLAHARFVRG